MHGKYMVPIKKAWKHMVNTWYLNTRNSNDILVIKSIGWQKLGMLMIYIVHTEYIHIARPAVCKNELPFLHSIHGRTKYESEFSILKNGPKKPNLFPLRLNWGLQLLYNPIWKLKSSLQQNLEFVWQMFLVLAEVMVWDYPMTRLEKKFITKGSIVD